MTKKYEELTFTDDFMFCKVLENNEELCRELVEVILGVRIEIVTQLGKQKAIELTPDGRGVRLDVYMEGDSRIFNLEMQNGRKKDLPRRSRYYQGLLDLDQMERGMVYEDLRDTFIIFICTFDPFEMGYSTYTVKTSIEENPEIDSNDGTHKIFLSSLPDQKGPMSPKLREFLDYINGKTPDGELTKRLDEAIKRAKSMESWRKEYMFLYEIKDEGRQEAREQLQELCEKMMADDRGSEYLDVMKSRNSARIDALLQEYGIADES